MLRRAIPFIILTEMIFGNEKNPNIIYILKWTPTDSTPFVEMGEKQKFFTEHNCLYKNCYVTEDHYHFDNVLDYDVLLFTAESLFDDYNIVLPKQRSENQKYGFVSIEPARKFPTTKWFDGYFNFTWTFKLNSDVLLPYVLVKNSSGEVIGPRKDMHWINVDLMNETSQLVRDKLKKKKVAAAWFVSNCLAKPRNRFVQEMQKELAKYGHRVDIYGSCGDLDCPKETFDQCYALIETDYYFYLAFENSFEEDYVTEKLLTALEHYAIPVVFGSANYSRFMPPGIYLNAYKLGVTKLVSKMIELMNDTQKYYDYFRWHGYYTFHTTDEDRYSREICQLCEVLNRKSGGKSVEISKWWNIEMEDSGRNVEEKVESEEGVGGFFHKLFRYFFIY